MAYGHAVIFGLNSFVITQLHQVFQKYPEIERVLIFGSRATGAYQDGSDIDLVVIAPAMSNHTFTSLWNEIDALPLVFKVDLLHWDRLSNVALKHNALQAGKQFFPEILK